MSHGIEWWDKWFLEMAKYVSTASKDPSTKTGAILVGPDNSVISVGFNGFPAGMPDSPELYDNREEKYSRIVHCEINALLHAGRQLPVGSTLYTTPFMSCDRCVVQMLSAGIRRYVAPVTSNDKLERWGALFEKTRRYIKECGGQLIEIGDNKDEDISSSTVQGQSTHACNCVSCGGERLRSNT